MGVSVKVNSGSLKNAINAIRLFTTKKDDQIKEIVADMAFAVDADAKALCPVDTGRLRASIHPEFSNGGLGATVGTDVEYAAIIELGGSRRTAQPYLAPAFEANRQSFLANMKKILSSK